MSEGAPPRTRADRVAGLSAVRVGLAGSCSRLATGGFGLVIGFAGRSAGRAGGGVTAATTVAVSAVVVTNGSAVAVTNGSAVVVTNGSAVVVTTGSASAGVTVC